MVVEFDPTALRPRPREPRDPIVPPRVVVLCLVGAGACCLLGLTIWVVLTPHIAKLAPVWRCDLGAGVEASPVVSGDTLVVATMDGSLWGLDPTTGEARYRAASALLGIGGGLAERDGIVYFGSDDCGVYAVSADTGEGIARTFTNGAVRTRPLVTEGAVYVGSDDGHLWTLARADLHTLGRPVYVGSAIAGDPIMYGGDVIFAPLAGDVLFLNTKTGALRRAEVPGPICSSPAVSAQGTVWIGNDAGYVYSIRADTLEVEPAGPFGGPVRSRIVEDRARVFVGVNGGSLRVLRAKPPTELYCVPSGGSVRARALVSEGLVLFGADDGGVRLLGATGGVRAFYATGGGRISAQPVIGPEGLVYVATTRGEVLALRLPGDAPTL